MWVNPTPPRRPFAALWRGPDLPPRAGSSARQDPPSGPDQRVRRRALPHRGWLKQSLEPALGALQCSRRSRPGITLQNGARYSRREPRNRTANPAKAVVKPALTFQGCIVSYSSKAAGSLWAGPLVPSFPSPWPLRSARSTRALAAPVACREKPALDLARIDGSR